MNVIKYALPGMLIVEQNAHIEKCGMLYDSYTARTMAEVARLTIIGNSIQPWCRRAERGCREHPRRGSLTANDGLHDHASLFLPRR